MNVGSRIAARNLGAARIVHETSESLVFLREKAGKMTINQQTIEGSWNQVKGKVRERWGQVSDNELNEVRGNIERLVGLIQEKTGEARSDVESYLEAAASDGASMVGRATETIVDQAQRAAETARNAGAQAVDSARAGYIQSEQFVRHRPVESLAVCFGAGFVVGVVVGLLSRSK